MGDPPMTDETRCDASTSVAMLPSQEEPAEEMGKQMPQSTPPCKAYTSDYWLRFARALSSYDRITDEHTIVARIVSQLLSDLPSLRHLEPLQMLDIGPGYGRLAHEITAPFHHRAAVEPNPYLRKALHAMYDRVYEQEWEAATPHIPSFPVILASQVVYYFPPALRSVCIKTMIDKLPIGGVLFLVSDAFEGAFGKFLVKWSTILELGEHVVSADIIRSVLACRCDVEIQETAFSVSLKARSLALFSSGVSVYFDVHPAISEDLPADYRCALQDFKRHGCYVAQNSEILWMVRKGA